MKDLLLRFACTALIAASIPTSGRASDLANLRVYPNPVRVYLGDTQVLFDGITGGTLTIYNARGSKVRETSFSSVAFFAWDLTNESNEPVASGVYHWVLEGADETRSGKVAIIR